jgi:adenylate cyclase
MDHAPVGRDDDPRSLMREPRVTRRLAAIVAVDVVGYSRLIGQDEEGTLARLQAMRRELIDPAIAAAGGRIVKTMGDGLLVEFPSTVDAVRAAVEVQRGMAERSDGLALDQRMDLRIGVHLGDVVVDDADLLGDGVNIAARLEGIAEPGGIAISEEVWRHAKGKVAAAFVDAGEQRLKNIAEPVRVYRLDPGATAPAPTVPPAPAEGGKPSIAVLPFTNTSGDPEQASFADGLTEDIITTLSKLAGLTVTARNSSFVYKDRAVDVREAAGQLGVRYVLEGSVRRSGNRIRITAQLIDAATGAHLWAERYDRAIDDIFAVQDEITLVLATELQVKLTEGEQARLHYTTTTNVAAWTHWVQGLFHYRQGVGRDNYARARSHWEKALALDPGSAVLHSMLGFLHYADARMGWWNDRATAVEIARGHVEKALALDPENADACARAGQFLLLEERWEEAAAQVRRAVRLAPDAGDIAAVACFVLATAGLPEAAIAYGERALTLTPNPPGHYFGHLGNAYRLAGRNAEAIAAFEAYHARNPGFGLVDLLIIQQEEGRVEAAKRAAELLLAARPDFTIGAWQKTQFRQNPARLDADLAALRAAGLPEG